MSLVGSERYIARYVEQALSSHDSAEEAATWLAIFVANDAASSRADRPRSTLVEAYRRVRELADVAARGA